MVPNDKGALAPATSAEELLEHVPGLQKMGIDLTVVDLLNKDSTNLTPENWQLLIRKIAELYSSYDGILVTHGTDTMAYTATAVSMAFGDSLGKPIVFTGSQLPMVDPGNDARVNLERSVRTLTEAIDCKVAEVMIVFSAVVLRANRTIKISEAKFNAFDSPAFPHLADISATDITFSPLALKKKNVKLSPSRLNPKLNFANGIVSINVRPGLNPELLLSIVRSDECSALILKSLGAGNVPSEGKYSLLPVIEETVKLGKPAVIATKFIGGKTVPEIYETGRAALEAGAGQASIMTDVTAEVKLMWLMGQGITKPKDVNKALVKSFIGEVG